MNVITTTVTSLQITDVDGLDPVRVMVENDKPGVGRITVTCFGKAWSGSWNGMGGRSVQQFFIDCTNDYLIDKMCGSLYSTTEDDNDANEAFVKTELLKLRRENDIDAYDARECWDALSCTDNIKYDICNGHSSLNKLPYFQDDVWNLNWPSIPNPEYQYVCRVFDAVREALKLQQEIMPEKELMSA